nr:oligosaccharide flippase family protein [Tsuneonella mangrovi]
MPLRETRTRCSGQVRKFLEQILGFGPSRLERDLAIGLALKGAGAVASFALSFLVAHALGAGGVGIFQIALTTAALASLAAAMGLDTVLVRTVSVAWREGDLAAAKGAIRRSVRFVAGLGVVIAIVVALASVPATRSIMHRPELLPSLLILSIAVPMLAIIRVVSAAIRGTGRVFLSQSLDGVAYTGIAALLLGVAFASGLALASYAPAAVYAGSTFAVAVAGMVGLRSIVRESPVAPAALPLRSGGRIVSVVLMAQSVDWLALVALGAVHGAAEAGIFRVAVQYCLLFAIINNAFAQMAGPHLATLYAKGDRRAMIAAARKTGLLGALVGIPLLGAILLAPSWLLGLFGGDFRTGATALVIMAIAQFTNVAAGPMGMVLLMTHREHLVQRIEIVATGGAIALLVLTIGHLGLVGAALTVAFAVVVRNVASIAAVWHQFIRRSDDGGAPSADG